MIVIVNECDLSNCLLDQEGYIPPSLISSFSIAQRLHVDVEGSQDDIIGPLPRLLILTSTDGSDTPASRRRHLFVPTSSLGAMLAGVKNDTFVMVQ